MQVDVQRAQRGQFFVRLRMQRAGLNTFGKAPLIAVIDHYIDSGSGDWLIPRCGARPCAPLALLQGASFQSCKPLSTCPLTATAPVHKTQQCCRALS